MKYDGKLTTYYHSVQNLKREEYSLQTERQLKEIQRSVENLERSVNAEIIGLKDNLKLIKEIKNDAAKTIQAKGRR